MKKYTWLFALIGALVLFGGYVLTAKDQGETAQPVITTPGSILNTPADGPVKEFTMTAYYDEKGKWYSLKEMTVKKGDRVHLTITNTKGMHDFTIDELVVKKELPLDEAVTIMFTASKAGDMIYYCSKPGHREGGQWGTLHVTE